jgi:catechol 2,3-dioxygenase-like lactoylglutathione lyase family enzyme
VTRPKPVPEPVCSDIERTLHFYIEILGFNILYEPLDEFV